MTERAPPIIFLMGPTGAGKSALALALAQKFPLDIVNVDSAQVYRGLDIGTAKPDPGERAAVAHHLLDICDPAESYSAARFRADALSAIGSIHAAGRIPILVGGTGLYFRALERGLAPLPAADPGLRQFLQAELAMHGPVALHETLRAVDPVSAARIHPHDPQRLLRALEIYRQTGQTMSDYLAGHAHTVLPFPTLRWVLAPSQRAGLHTNLARRFEMMLARGFVNEVLMLKQRADLSRTLPALRAVGYRAVWRYLDGELGHAEMVESSVAATRQLAKRQLTWFRAAEDVTWWDSEASNLRAKAMVALAAFLDSWAGIRAYERNT